jgi:hypothetical protein
MAHLGGCSPGDRSHSLTCAPVSACRAFLSVASRTARWKQFGFLAQSFRLFGKTVFKGFDLFETASLLLHGAAPLLVLGGSATGVLITDKSHGPGGDGD